MIPYGRQNITDDDINAVVSALKSDFLTQGPRVKEFEDAFATYVNAEYAVAVANGTAALHLAALAINIKPGDKVITTPITFAASANCIRYCGGVVVFADIDPHTYLLSIESVAKLLSSAPKGTYAGIIPVDLAGLPVDLEAFRQLADQYGLWIIEDACHAPGGFFIDSKNKKQLCGNGQYADMSVFSFHPVKHIACGEGGMITTNSKHLYEQLLMLRTHGITRNSDQFANEMQWAGGNSVCPSATFPGWYMEMEELGYNYRLTDFQAALGTSQLKRVNEGLLRRHDIASKYCKAFKGEYWLYGQSGYFKEHAYHLYIIEVKDRLGLYNYLRSRDIHAQVHYIPTHLMPYYKKLGWKEGDFPNAEHYYAQCLSLPMYPTLTEAEQIYVIDSVKAYYS